MKKMVIDSDFGIEFVSSDEYSFEEIKYNSKEEVLKRKMTYCFFLQKQVIQFDATNKANPWNVANQNLLKKVVLSYYN